MTSKRMGPTKAIRHLEEHADHLTERARSRDITGLPTTWDAANAAACRIGAEAIRAQKGEMEDRQKIYEALEAALVTLEQVEAEATMTVDLRREVMVSVSAARKIVADMGDPEPAVAVR